MSKSGWNRAALAGVVLLAGGGLAAQEVGRPVAAAKRVESRLDVDYSFAVERDGKPSDAAAIAELRAGDRFHVRVRPKQTAYAYLFVSKDERAFDLVLPKERDKKMNAMVDRNAWSTLPDQDWLRFDKNRGVERAYLIVSTAKVDEIEDMMDNGRAPDSVDETWLLDLRTKLEGEGNTVHDRTAQAVRVSHRRKGAGPATLFETFTIRHK